MFLFLLHQVRMKRRWRLPSDEVHRLPCLVFLPPPTSRWPFILCNLPTSSFPFCMTPSSPPALVWLMQLKQHALLWLVKRNQVRCFCEVWSPSTSYCAVNSVSRHQRGRKGTVVTARSFLLLLLPLLLCGLLVSFLLH